MSVQKRPDGKWQVRWRDGSGRQLARNFDRKSVAERFEADVKLRRRNPRLAAELDRERLTLKQYVDGPFRAHAATLAQPTRDKYRWALEKHLAPLAHDPLLAIDAIRIAETQRDMLDAGATPATVREVLTRLSGVLQTAVGQGIIPVNYARAVRKVPAEPSEEVRALAPAELEQLIDQAAGRERAIVLLGGRLGLRPGELRLAPWTSIDAGTFTLSRTVAKRTASRTRVLELDAYTVRALKEWQLQAGRPHGDQPIIGDMTANALKLWGARWLRPRVAELTAGRIDDATVKTLRHSHASALHYAGYTVPEAARRMGHGPGVHIDTYAHVIDAMSGTRHDGLDELYTAARRRPAAHTERTSDAT